ncbi:MAG: protein DpdH [Dehalococcoidia bacterium]
MTQSTIPEWRTPRTCWTPHEARGLPVEAEEMSVAQFLQTHVQLDLSRVNATSLETVEERLTEIDVLDDLRARIAENDRDTDIIPVLGDSGAGKSHLVRWLRHALMNDVPDTLRVVFIPKHRTSLRGVVDRVLSAFRDVPELGEIRQALLSASDRNESAEELRSRLRNVLADGLEFHADRTDVEEAEREARDALARSLPPLLRDGHFGPRYLADGSAIARLVEEKLTGRAGSDAAEEAFHFKEEDVTVNPDDVGSAAEAARGAVKMLLQNPPTTGKAGDRPLTELAVLMLNDQLPSAVKEVFGVGGSDLKDLFVKARAILHGRQDILLLVEDFAMFQGLQDGLVDAITVMVSGEGEEPLCALLTMFAVTTGYYDNHIPSTLKTRSGRAYVVGDQLPDAPSRFAASYLRAIRLGSTELEKRHSLGQTGESSCKDCSVREVCHDGFGEVDGEGLFPFNTTMLDRASSAAMRDGFNARRFLNQVLRPVLIEDHKDFENESFPPARVAERFSLSRFEPDGDALIRARSETDGDQRARAALLYKSPVDSGDMPSAIHGALAIRPLGIAGGMTQTPPEPSGGGQASKQTKPKAKQPTLVSAIDRWRQIGSLTQDNRRSVRKLVTAAVLVRIDFNDGGWRRSAWTAKPAGPFFDSSGNSVLLDDDGNPDKGAVQLHLSWKSPEDVDAVQTLAWLDANGSFRNIDGGAERAARLEVTLRRWADSVIESLGLRTAEIPSTTKLVEALELVHALRGIRKDGVQDRTAMVVGDLPAEHGLTKLEEEAHSVLVTHLRRSVGYARGTGAVVAVDVTLMQHALRRVDSGKLLEAAGASTPKQVRTIDDAIAVIASSCAAITGDSTAIRERLPDTDALGSDDPTELAQELRQICSGHASETAIQRVEQTAEDLRPRDVPTVERAFRDVQKWSELGALEQVALARGPWMSAAQRVGAFVSAAEHVLAAATPSGTVHGQGDRAVVEGAWARALEGAGAAVGRVRKDLL